jgi:hypothetical protein
MSLTGAELFWKQMEDYVLFEQMIREVLQEVNKGDGARTNTEERIGIKHW